MEYHQLTKEQRYHMHGLQQNGQTQAEIARQLGVHRSTVSRELRRNRGPRGWRPSQAHQKAQTRCTGNQHARRFFPSTWRLVDHLLRQSLSPEQVVGRLDRERALPICTETIYAHIYADKKLGGDLHQHLRHQKRRRKRYGSGQERRGVLKNRVGIELRPPEVELRARLGDWEGDTVIGKNHRGALVTMVERKSRFTAARMLPNREAQPVAKAIAELLQPLPAKVHTITFDNGKEFAQHEAIAEQLGAEVYFARPYHSWERGLNENTNGLLRQYFPKGTDFSTVTPAMVSAALFQLNHRPRKVLEFRSPYEVLYGVEVSYAS